MNLKLLVPALLLVANSGYSQEKMTPNTVENKGKIVNITSNWEGKAVESFSARGNDIYRVGYFIQDGKIIPEHSLLANKKKKVESLDLDMTAYGDGYSAVIAHGKGTDITITGSIYGYDNSEGDNASDFSGLGTMVVASDGAKVTLDKVDIKTKGFVRAAFIADQNASITVKNSKIITLGANPLTDIRDGYVNHADISKMLSPPWVLGIQGGVRASNMLGAQPTTNVINSSITAGSWGVLSVDGAQSPVMNVVDADLRILPEAEGGMSSGPFAYSSHYGSGYASYAIGNAQQNFYGTHISGTTYATIFTGGKAHFSSSVGEITLSNAQQEKLPTIKGRGRITTINSVWGFMSHGDAVLHVNANTEVNTEEATFLYKSGNAEIHFNHAKLNPKSGVILQMMDNDDRIVGQNAAGGNAVFNTEFNEQKGWPSENGNLTSEMDIPESQQNGMPMPPPGMTTGSRPPGPPGGRPPRGMPPLGMMPPNGMPPQGGGPNGAPPQQGNRMVVGADGRPLGAPPMRMAQSEANVYFTNGMYRGDLLNGTGYYGQNHVPMAITIGKNASVTGQISLTETRHIDEQGKQNTHFTHQAYYYLGHVENRNYRCDNAKAAVTLKDGGTWIVTKESLLSSLTIEDSGIYGANGKTVVMTVDGVKQSLSNNGVYEGDIVLRLE